MSKRKLTDEQRRARRRLLDRATKSKRDAALHLKARAAGYKGMSQVNTMIINGVVTLPPCPEKTNE